jgi:hypothetical protein
LVGADIRRRCTDDDDLANQFFLTELPRLAVLWSRVLSLSRSSVFSYVLSLDQSGSADGRGMAAGWSRRTTMFLSDPAGLLDRVFFREPKHDDKELNHEVTVSEDMLPGFMQPVKEKGKASCLEEEKRKASSDQHPETKKGYKAHDEGRRNAAARTDQPSLHNIAGAR